MSEEIRAEDVEAFAGNMFGHLVGAATVICSELAHKLGFYGHLAGSGGMTASELAKVAGTHERLTRELLDQQTYLPKDESRLGYKANLFNWGSEVYYRDYNIEVDRKFNKNFKLKGTFAFQEYNIELIQFKASTNVLARIWVLEGLNKLSRKHSIRWEAQHLTTGQDQGDWVFGLIEYGYSPHWIVTVLNQYNYGNKNKDLRHGHGEPEICRYSCSLTHW